MEKDITENFGAYNSELCGWEYNIPQGFTAEIKNGKIIVREEESKDEKIRNCIKQIVEEWFSNVNRVSCIFDKDDVLNWLDSKKENYSGFNKEQRKYMEKYIPLDKVTLVKLLGERDRNIREIDYDSTYEEVKDYSRNAIGMLSDAGYINNHSRNEVINWLRNLPNLINKLNEQ